MLPWYERQLAKYASTFVWQRRVDEAMMKQLARRGVRGDRQFRPKPAKSDEHRHECRQHQIMMLDTC